jgi:excisionase family DNA binding protein
MSPGKKFLESASQGGVRDNKFDDGPFYPMAYSIPAASKAAGVSRSFLYEKIKSGELRAVKNGRRTQVIHADLRRWIENLPEIDVATTNPRE